jgi:EAL domain-containing protein (putative c-di-GMP-specific phosphodiesterase class I)
MLAEVSSIVDSANVRVLYQPVVDVATGDVVGYEALARGPERSPLARPDHLFEAARAAGRLAELDWLCRAGALRAALESGLRPPLTLFLNVEPTALNKPVPGAFHDRWVGATSQLRVVIEITERALTEHLAEVMWSIEWARELGWGVALDDVGADPRSLAMLQFLRPDVIKVDLGLLGGRGDGEAAEVVHAVAAEAERTGALVLAERVERDGHLVRARALGASLAQGWLFGRPGPLPAVQGPRGPEIAIDPQHRSVPSGYTPFDILSQRRPSRRAGESVLLELSRSLERQARNVAARPIVLSCFQDESRFTRACRKTYADLAHGGAFVAALGVGMSVSPARGVRGAALSTRDPVRHEWVVTVVGPNFTAALAARDLGDVDTGSERRFDYAVTYQRDLVMQVALPLMARVIAS